MQKEPGTIILTRQYVRAFMEDRHKRRERILARRVKHRMLGRLIHGFKDPHQSTSKYIPAGPNMNVDNRSKYQRRRAGLTV